jgi:hypothetical protein
MVLAASKFRTEAEEHWNHHDFFEAIQEVYRISVPRDRLLREIVVDVIHKHKGLLDRHEYQKIVSRNDLSFKLLVAVQRAGVESPVYIGGRRWLFDSRSYRT